MTAKRASTKKAAGEVAKGRTAAVAAAGAGDGDTGLVTQGFIRVTINDEPFELRGTVGDYLKVAWHKSFEEGVDLGTAPELAGAVAGALAVADPEAFTAELNAKLEAVKNLPIAGTIAAIVEKAHVKVTDIGIDTLAGKYEFGFGWDLSAVEDAKYRGISIDAFGLVFTYTKSADSE